MFQQLTLNNLNMDLYVRRKNQTIYVVFLRKMKFFFTDVCDIFLTDKYILYVIAFRKNWLH